jgi:hypothetical protein
MAGEKTGGQEDEGDAREKDQAEREIRLPPNDTEELLPRLWTGVANDHLIYSSRS